MRIGDRVRYRYGERDTGTIVNAARYNGDWMVRWDHDPHGPRLLAAYEQNLEPATPNPPAPGGAGPSGEATDGGGK